MKEIVVKYSGGTDSTAAAALAAESHDRVRLVTYRHSGISNIRNSAENIKKLSALYGQDKFTHEIIDMDALFRAVTYNDYLRNVRGFGFFNLTTCGLCKLAMHVRTIVYCIDNGVAEVADGANRNSFLFPAQMEPVLVKLRGMYGRFGINFTNPVFDYDFPGDIDWRHKFGLVEKTPAKPGKTTTGQLLSSRGILDKDNVKGTATDRGMQGLCFQLVLLNLFALKYYIPGHGLERYREMTAVFYGEKIERFTRELEIFLGDGESVLSRVIKGRGGPRAPGRN